MQLGSYFDQIQEIQHTQIEGSSKCMQLPALQIKRKNCSSKSLHQVRKQKEKNISTREEMLRPNGISQVGKNQDCCTEIFTFFSDGVSHTMYS